jgi:ubiquinone/menaquinone biosynthesis C-methylase UbiE/alkylhydroperoxidase/carboxymuconolactone decarboxylase family protein YurZ/uncharacterized protein YbaR (Trm112 family)
MTPADVALLRCPTCHGSLVFLGKTDADAIETGSLQCQRCAHAWPVRAGLPHLYEEATVRGSDRFLRIVYDIIAPFHDAAVRFALPLMQFSSAEVTRDGYMERLELASLAPQHDGAPLRILEVGIGGGANLPLIERDLPMDVDVEMWGADLSAGMIEQCRRRLRSGRLGLRVRLLLADAHDLPFPDASFDRVFHVGGIAGYRDPARGLAEMARVARPGTPIVVVDEQLDPHGSHGLYQRLIFRAITIYDPRPHAPREHVPAGAVDVVEEQVSRFYYCLSFHMPPKRPAQATPPGGSSPISPGKEGHPMTVKDILSSAELAKLVTGYDEAAMKGILTGFFPQVYPPTQAYTDAISEAFYGALPPDDATPPRSMLSLRDRERCLISILASRGAGLTLAIHMYIALMHEVSAEEIAHILFLAGIYTGVDNLAGALAAEVKLLTELKALALLPIPPGPVAVVTALRLAFPR